MSEEKVHKLTESELQDIIQKAISESNKQPRVERVVTHHNLFDDLSSELQAKIVDLNTKNDIPPYASRGIRDAIYGNRKDRPMLAYELHGVAKKATLLVLGASKNADLLYSEFLQAREIYKNIANLLFDEYEKRLNNAKKATTPTTK